MWPPRGINFKYGTSDIQWFKYLFPLDDEIAERVKPLSKHYPNMCATSETSDTPGDYPGEGRAAQTVSLQ
jgi:hypothetical protein